MSGALSSRPTCVVLLAAAALAATVTGCSGSNPKPTAPSVSAASPTAAISRAATSLTGAPSSSSGVADSGTRQQCAESQLRASIDPRPVPGQSTGQHGDKAVIVDFRNISDTTCTLRGYPGAALVGSDGRQAVQAERTIRGELLGLPRSQTTLPTATLRPGAYASAGIEGTNYQQEGAAQAGCDATYPRILVTPPNTATSVPFLLSWPRCYTFTVHPTNIENNPPS